jgi:hypothetical protein
MSPASYRMLDGDWPVLQQANKVPLAVYDLIKAEGNGSAITSNLGFFLLGKFYIDTALLVPHSTQRAINTEHADELVKSFQTVGPFRTESPGVVIGLGDGWYQMKNSGPTPYMISRSCPHLHYLCKEPNGAIGEIIRGNHRTEAIKRYSLQSDNPQTHENYWYYEVLVPSKPFLLYLSSCIDVI